MKVYLFNVDNGLYEGEEFRSPAELEGAEGVTREAPPPYEAGTAPVYDRNLGRWRLVPVASLRQGATDD